MDDKHIIKLLFDRSEQALALLARQFGPRLLLTARNILGDAQDAEECVNDGYLCLWNTVPVERPRLFAAYLYKILRNLAMKRLTRNRAEKRSPVFEELVSELEDYLPSAETVESQMEQRELKRLIEEFLDSLTPENRKIFMRRYWFSESYEKIAKDLGLSKSNVSMHLKRTKEKMRKFLEERGVNV